MQERNPKDCEKINPPDLDERLNALRKSNKDILVGVSLRENKTSKSHTYSKYVLPGQKTHCPSNLRELREEVDGDTDLITSCPTYNLLNVDENRYPKVVKEKDCRCSTGCGTEFMYNCGCLTNIGRTYVNSAQKLCKPIYIKRIFLRKTNGCQNGYAKFNPEWIPIKVGCSCSARLN